MKSIHLKGETNSTVESFLELQANKVTTELWDNTYKNVLIKSLELRYKTELLKHYGIVDIVINGDTVLFKWEKRMIPLSEEQLKKYYGE